MIKAIFFDLDGTLCDSDTAWGIAQREIFQLLREHYPNVSEGALTNAWQTVHQELFKQLSAGKMLYGGSEGLAFPVFIQSIGSTYR